MPIIGLQFDEPLMLALGKRLPRIAIRPESLTRLVPLVTSLLVILLAHDFAQLSWQLFSTAAPTAANIATAVDKPTTTNRHNIINYALVADWHLFGEISERPSAAPATVAAPETTLNLKLVGILHSADDGKARALIAADGKLENSYSAGEFLDSGIRLEQILRDKVILSRNGRLEALSLPIESNAASGSTAFPVNARSVRPQATTEQTVNASSIASQLREAVATQPGALQDLAFADPYIEDNQFIGFRLRPGRNRQMLSKLGLRSGDVITEINGTPLDSPAQGLAMLQELMHAGQISTKILRNGTEIPYTFTLNQ